MKTKQIETGDTKWEHLTNQSTKERAVIYSYRILITTLQKYERYAIFLKITALNRCAFISNA